MGKVNKLSANKAAAKGPRMRKLAPTTRVAKISKPARKPINGASKLYKPFRPIISRILSILAILLAPIARIIGKVIPPYFKNAWAELRQTTWPNGRETRRLTLAVFIFALVFGLLIAGVDKVLDQIFKYTVLK